MLKPRCGDEYGCRYVPTRAYVSGDYVPRVTFSCTTHPASQTKVTRPPEEKAFWGYLAGRSNYSR